MNSRDSHNIFTRQMYPWMSNEFLNLINQRIDSPSPQEKRVEDMVRNSQFGGWNPVESDFGIWKKKGNHRMYGHNFFTGMSVATQYGIPGIQAFLAHITADLQSDMLRNVFGYHGRNLIEAGMMYNLEGAKNINKRRNELNAFMPIPSMGMLPQNSRAPKVYRRGFSKRVYPRFTRRY